VTIVGGFSGQGTVYELTPARGGWKEKVLYAFSGPADGAQPFAGLAFDSAGNLYGAAQIGGSHGFGTVYQLTSSGSGWAEKTLYDFQGASDGAAPVGSLILDQSGNLYGPPAPAAQVAAVRFSNWLPQTATGRSARSTALLQQTALGPA
jgi:uncharacterized repeat protein (TIGR03803 family)